MECRRVMRAASRNYAFAGIALPRAKRPHVEALYALLRVGDDRVDVSHSGFASPLAAIDDWETSYRRAFETGCASHPVLRAYLNTAVLHHIPADLMRPYFRAMRDDLTVTRYATFDDLLYYMEGSAVPVGRAMTYILGIQPGHSLAEALSHADSLSIAMQLSNFWRDIHEDLLRDRVYIPSKDLERFGISDADLAAGEVTPGLAALFEFEFERTERYYRHAREGIRLLASGRCGVMCGLRVYRAILSAIRRQGYDIFSRRAEATTAQKLGHLIAALFETRVPFKSNAGLRRTIAPRSGT